MSYEQALVKLPRAVFYLNQYKTIDTTDVRRLLVFLRQFSGPLKTTVADQRVRWVEQLLNENVLQICLNFWRITFTPRIFSKKFEEEMRNFRNIIGIIWNSTEISRPCCINVCDNNGVKVLLDTINADCLNDAKLKLQDMSNINRVYVSHSSGAILKNILYSYCDAKRLFRQVRGIFFKLLKIYFFFYIFLFYFLFLFYSLFYFSFFFFIFWLFLICKFLLIVVLCV